MIHRRSAPGHASTRLIVTADDFGLNEAVNEAVERSHREGILSATSLMVSAPGAGDAIRRARALPGLGVGLHLVLVDGKATLPAADIPDLVNADGCFHDNMVRAGIRFFFLPRVRKQLSAEIRAQFNAFSATGLCLDHVNAHKHFHLHPTVLGLMLSIGREYGLRAVRIPCEPLRAAWGVDRNRRATKILSSLCLAPWIVLMRGRIRRASLTFNHALFGLSATGAMDEAMLLRILDDLPPGVVEIYLHPATRSGREISPAMDEYRHTAEMAALMSAEVRRRLLSNGPIPQRYLDIAVALKDRSTDKGGV